MCTFLIYCGNRFHEGRTRIAYQGIAEGFCNDDTTHRYHYLLPAEMDGKAKLPLIVALDAHGDGNLAVSRIRDAVTLIPCIVVGSDLVRNNFSDYDYQTTKLIHDISLKFPVDTNRIIVSGFSGGARMAVSYAWLHKICGLLLCSAGTGKIVPQCPAYGIFGTRDFNFVEQYYRPAMENFQRKQIMTDYFHGKHEWPPATEIGDGILRLLMNCGNEYNEIAQLRSEELLEIADSLEEAGDYFFAWKAVEKAAGFNSDPKKVRDIRENARTLLRIDALRDLIWDLEDYLQKEKEKVREYAGKSMKKDLDWWKVEIGRVRRQIDASHDSISRDHFMRVKALMGIIFFTRLNYFLHDIKVIPQVEVLLGAFEALEPDNSDIPYFRALKAWIEKDNEACIAHLREALEAGFTDMQRMRSDFPEELVAELEEP